MSDVMKRMKDIEKRLENELDDTVDTFNSDNYLRLDDVSFLISTIKQLHAENEQQQEQIEKLKPYYHSYYKQSKLTNEVSGEMQGYKKALKEILYGPPKGSDMKRIARQALEDNQ